MDATMHVERRTGDGGAVLAELADASVDLLFPDAERVEHAGGGPTRRECFGKGLFLAWLRTGAPRPGQATTTG
jgi:hypothetical protein